MRKRFLLEGDYQNREVWIAIAFKDEAISLLLHLFWKGEVKKELLQEWVKGAAELPEAIATIERSITDENLLTEEIKVINVGKVREIEIEWADNILLTRVLQGFDGELLVLKDRISLLEAYDQDVFDECARFWERLIAFKKDNASFSNQKLDVYKSDLDILFEALKALKKDHKKEQQEKAIEIKANFVLKLEILNHKLEENPNHKFTVERLKEIRAELNKSGLRQQHYTDIDNQINALFEKMSGPKVKAQTEKFDKRIQDLEGIAEKMQKSLDWDLKEMEKEKKNKDFSQQIFQMKLIDAKIDMIQKRVIEKQEKLANVLSTLQGLKKKSK